MSGIYLPKYEKKEGDFEECPEGVHVATLARIWDCGLQDGKFGLKRTVCLVYETDATDSKGRQFVLFDKATLSTSDKSNLYGMLEALLGKAPDPGMDIRTAEGRSVRVQVIHDARGRPRIKTVIPLGAKESGPKVTQDHGKPFGLAKWLMDHAVTEQSEADFHASTFSAPTPGADDDVPF